MYTVYAPNSSRFTVSTQNITIPNQAGLSIQLPALFYQETPFVKVVSAIALINKARATANSNLHKHIHSILCNAKAATGEVIVTSRGIYASPRALRNILSTFFLDYDESPDAEVIDDIKQPHWGSRLPVVRVVRDSRVYAALLIYGNASDVRFKGKSSCKNIPESALQELCGGYTTCVSNGEWHVIPMNPEHTEGSDQPVENLAESLEDVKDSENPVRAADKTTVQKQLNKLFRGLDIIGIIKLLREAGIKVTLDVQL